MRTRTSSINYPPGPTQKLSLVLFINFLRDPIGVLIDISKSGDISHFKFGTQHIYFLNHPDYIRFLLAHKNVNYDNGSYVISNLQLREDLPKSVIKTGY